MLLSYPLNNNIRLLLHHISSDSKSCSWQTSCFRALRYTICMWGGCGGRPDLHNLLEFWPWAQQELRLLSSTTSDHLTPAGYWTGHGDETNPPSDGSIMDQHRRASGADGGQWVSVELVAPPSHWHLGTDLPSRVALTASVQLNRLSLSVWIHRRAAPTAAVH